MTGIIDFTKRLFEEGIGAAAEFVDETVENVISFADEKRRELQYGDNLIGSGYRGAFLARVAGALRSQTYGARVRTLSARELRDFEYTDEHTGESKRGLLGFREDTDEGPVIYVPRADSAEELVDSELTSEEQRGIPLYIWVHEVMEASEFRPRSSAEHEEFEVTILNCLRNLASYGDSRAETAYRGGLKMLELGKERGDAYYSSVAQRSSIEEELAGAA